jgi:4-hydroxy-tetrahydrodipicolinate reductase
MPYRVIQFGTGNVGKHALRSIVERSDLELVGLRVYDDSKAGVDAGEILGIGPVGVTAVATLEQALSVEADCVNYNALGTTTDMGGRTLDEICEMLRRGYNVSSSAIDFSVYPESIPKPILDRLREACSEGNSTYFGTGVNPGFTMDLWPITMTRLSRRIDRIRILETLDMHDYTSKSAMSFMGFGKAPDEPSPLDAMHNDAENSPFYSSMLLVADALNLEMDDYSFSREVDVAKEDFETGFGTIRRGQVAVVKMRCAGGAYGRDVLINEWVWRTSNDVRPEWGVGEFWDMQIDGDPSMHCVVEARTDFDSKRIVSLTVATATVNAIPTLCEAPPGVKSYLDLPTWGGGLVFRDS